MHRLFPSQCAETGPGACSPGAMVPERATLSLRGVRGQPYDAALAGGVRAAIHPGPGRACLNT